MKRALAVVLVASGCGSAFGPAPEIVPPSALSYPSQSPTYAIGQAIAVNVPSSHVPVPVGPWGH